MKPLRRITLFISLLLPAIGWLTNVQAQTITTGTIASSSFCAGVAGTVSVPFSTSGAFGAGTVFTAQLSNGAGSFATPVALGTLTASPASVTTLTINGTIPASTSEGTGFRVRVVSATPASGTVTASAVIGSLSPTTLIGSRPAAPTVTGGTGPYCQGATATAVAVTGQGLRYYDASGQLLSGSPVISTSTPGTQRFGVSQTVSGCESAQTSFSVIVNALPPVPTVVSPVVLCQGATAQPLSASLASAGNSLRWYGNSATGGVASTTAPTPSNQVSNTYYVSQVDGNGCESSRAPITVTVNALPAGPTITSTSPLCQNTTASALSAAGQNVRWFDQSGNSLPGAPTPSTSTPGSLTYLASQIVNGCETPVANRSVAIITINPSPGPPAVSGSPAYCVGATTAPLSATATGGGTLLWYGRNATGGTGSSTPTVPTATAADAGQTINYYVSQQLNGCESARASIAVQIKALPGLPTVSPIVLCQNAVAPTTLATPASGGTLNWYGSNATGGTASATTPVIVTTTATSYSLYVSQTVNGCEGSRATLPVTINALPGAPVVSASFAVCQGATPLPLSATGTGVKWYDSTGQPVAGTPVPPTTAAGSLTYTAAQVINGCETPAAQRAAVVVTVNPSPAPPTVSTPIAYCVGATTVPLSATANGSATLLWYGRNATGGIGSGTPTVPTATAADAGQTINYYVSQQLNGCESARASIAVQVKILPGSPTVSAVVLCQNAFAPATLATPASGGTLNWYGENATGGTASATTPVIVTTTATSYSLYVSQTVNGCEGSRAAVPVTVNALPAAPVVSASFAVCQGATPLPLSATGTGIKWYGPTGQALAGTPVVSTNTVGSFTYTAAQTVNGCETSLAQRAAVVVTVNPTPEAPGVVSSVSYCVGTTAVALSAVPTSGATLLWYGRNATGGTGSSTPTVPATSPTESGQTINYYVSQQLNGCESTRTLIAVQVKPLPGSPTVGAIAFCQGANPLPLVAAATGGATLLWYQNQTGGTGSATVPVVSNATPGVFTYYVSQILNGCESAGRAAATVEVKPAPAVPTVVPVSYCQRQQDQPAQVVLPFTATGESLQWYNLDGNKFPSAPTVSIDNVGTTTVQVTQTSRGCESQKATATITVQTTPTPVPATPVVVYCRTDQAVPLVASTVAGGSLRWIDPNGNLTTDAPVPATLNATKPGGELYYVYQIGSNGCYSARSTIRLTVNTVPTLSLVGPSGPVNLGLPATLQLRFTSVPPFTYSLNDGTIGTARDTVISISVLPARTFVYQVASVSNVCGVGLPGNPATATVTIISPVITTGAVSAATVCAGSGVTVPFTTSGTFNPGNVFKVQLADTVSKQFIDLATNVIASPVTVTIPANAVGGPSFIRVVGTNPAIQVNGSNRLLNVRPRPLATLSGNQDIFEGGTATLSISLTGDGPWSLVYTDSLRIVPVTATTNPYLLQVIPARTSTYRLQSVSNGCGVGTVTGTATVRVLTALGIDPLAESVKTYPIPVLTVLIVDVDQPLAAAGVTLTLTDLTGKTVLTQTTRLPRTELNLADRPSGLYLLRIQAGDRHTVRKILKE